MAASSTNRIGAAVVAEAIAAVLARAAHHLDGQRQAATAEALLRQARHNRIQSLRLRAEQYFRTKGKTGSDGAVLSLAAEAQTSRPA